MSSSPAAHTVARDSPLFRAAVHRGDANEALRLGRNLLMQCQLVLQELGHVAARNGWARRVSLQQQPVNLHAAEHYAAICENVVLLLRGMGLTDIRQDMHCLDAAAAADTVDCEQQALNPAEAAAAAAAEPGTRAHEIAAIHRDLHAVGQLYTTVEEQVKRADPYIDRFEKRIEETGPRIDWAADAFLQHYVDTAPAAAARPAAAIACTLALLVLLTFGLVF